MNRLITRFAFTLLMAMSGLAAFSQSISLDVSPNVICFGKPLQVRAILSGVSPNDVTSYRFDWGNGDSTINNLGNPVNNQATKQYAAAGAYQVTVTARFSNRPPLSTSYWDTVYNLPVATFALTSLDSQCFTGNSYCFTESATPGPAPSLPLTTRLLTYGDGVDEILTPGGTACHTYGKGGVPFNVGYSVTDAGGCASQAFRFIYVGIDLRPRFAVSGNPKCDTTPYVFVNQTPVSPSLLQWFRWEFDDGTFYQSADPIVPADLAMWSNFTHWYTVHGTFNPKLTIKGKQLNCTETFEYGFTGLQLPENIILRFDLRSRRTPMNDTISDSVCIANLMAGGVCLYNMYSLQGTNTPIQILWDFADPNANPPGSDKFLNQAGPCYKYLGTGHFFPKLYVQCPGKPVKRLDFWSRISLPSASDTLYADPPIANPRLNTINGYIFTPNDDIEKFRFLPGYFPPGVVGARDSITAYWKFFTNDSIDRFRTYRRGDLVGFGINILGPTVAIENPIIPIVVKQNLKVQCAPSFPVEFVNASSTYQSFNLYIKWDFGDDYAPRCTSFAVPDPSKPNGGNPPYTTAIDLTNRTLPRFVVGGRIYPGGVNCNFSHDSLPIHKYEQWKRIYQWFRYGHDYPPYDSSATGWTTDPGQASPGGKKLVAPLDLATWGLPMFSSGPTPSRIDTLARMWPQDINPNRPITVNNGNIPDPIANYYGYWELTFPNGTTIDTSGFLKQSPGGPNLILPNMPNGVSRRYRGNTVIPGSGGMTLYEYFFNRVIQRCPTVRLQMKDSFNNQSTDPLRNLVRINMKMSDSSIVINQEQDTTIGAPKLILDTDTFSFARGNIFKRNRNPANQTLIKPADTLYDATGTNFIIIPAETTTVVMKTYEDTAHYIVYNYYEYTLYKDALGYYIMFPEDHFFVDGFDCGGTSTLQLPLVGADGYGLGFSGKICPGTPATNGGAVRFEFGRRDSFPGTYPDCGGRTFLLFNYDSLADRTDLTPCDLDGFVQFDGTHPTSGAVTPGGNVWPAFYTQMNFFPLSIWTSPGGTFNITHYEPDPAIAWPYTRSPKDPRGFVTVGIIIGSGCNNSACTGPDPNCLTDTVWYHKFLHLVKVNPFFTYRKVGGYIEYGVPSRLPSQDYTYDSAQFYPATAGGPIANPNYKRPWNRLYGKGDIIEFEPLSPEQEYVLAEVWDWGDGHITIDTFFSNTQDTFIRLNPSDPNDSTFFEKHAFPLKRVRYEVDGKTWLVTNSYEPYVLGTRIYRGVRRDTVWRCDDPTHAFPPQSIKVTNIYIDTNFTLLPTRHQYFKSSWEMADRALNTYEITRVFHIVSPKTKCERSTSMPLIIGVIDTFAVWEEDRLSDGILCIGQTATFIDSIRYSFPKSGGTNGEFGPNRPLDFPADYIFPGGEVEIYNDNHGRAMGGYPIDSIKTFINYSKYYVTLGTCPFGWQAAPGPVNTTCYKIDTAFFERIYWDFESDGVIDYAGKNAKHKFDIPGEYKVSMITRDTVGYYDTCVTYLNVVEPVAKFSTLDVFNCDNPVKFYDSSYIIDGCVATTGVPCDNVDWMRWWFGDVGFDSTDWRSSAPNPSYAYAKNGWYSIMQVVKTQQGCFDTARKDIYLSGPRPRIKILGDTLGCVPYKLKIVSFPNDSGVFSQTPATFIRPGRPDGAYETILLNNPDTVEVVYDYEGVFELTAVGYDTYPITNAICPPVVVPDTASGQRIRIYVKNPYNVEIASSKDVVCVGEPFIVSNRSSMDTITKFRMYAYNEDYSAIVDTMFKTNFLQDTTFQYVFNSTGYYHLVMHSTSFIENTPKCSNYDTVTVRAMKAKADLKIDSLGLPKYFIWNKSDSANASSYIWRIYNPDGTIRLERPVPSNNDPFFNLGEYDFGNDTGTFRVCIWAITAGMEYCIDSACQEISNSFQIDFDIPNVFTPNGDGANDVFNVKIKGEEMYELKIWNRWGGLVFETTDAKVQWNGRTMNTGEENPEGTYFYVLKYRLRGQTDKTANGSITLIRE